MCDNVDLIEACKSGYCDRVLTLLKRNYSVHVRDSKQATPLYHSCCHGHYEISLALIQYGSDVNARVEWGSTALHAAADRGHLECVKLLIQRGANLSLKNNRGDTALHLCAYRGYIDIVRVFIQAKCDLFIKNNSEKTPSDEAESNNHYNTAALLRHSMIAVQQTLGHQSTVYTPDIGTSREVRVYPSNIHSLSSVSVPPSQNKNDNFVRYSADLTRFTQQSQLPDRTGLSKTQVVTQNRPKSQPAISYTSYSNGHDRTQKNPYSSFNGHVSKSTPTLDINMLENKKYFVHGQDAMENFAETLQLQLVKKIEEGDFKDKKIRELHETLLEQSDKMKDLALTCARLEAENKQLKKLECKRSSYTTTIQNASLIDHQGIKDAIILLQHRNQCIFESSVSIETLKEVLKNRILNQPAPFMLDVPDKEWKVGKDFTLLGDKPLNYSLEGDRDRSCSLVFLISHNKREYVLKMMTNLINLQASQHGDGYSMDQFLFQNFGPEHKIPVMLPPHPNIVTILHHYMGPTDRFKKFTNLLISNKTDTPYEMATRTTFLVTDKYEQTLKSFMVQKRKEFPEPNYGLDAQFLLQLFYQIMSAIYHLQKNGVVHRDIKADNVFLDSSLRPILSDFGFAKTLTSTDGNQIKFSDSRQVYAGNSDAWAPELIRYNTNQGQKNDEITLQEIYEKADAYAACRMFYTLLRPVEAGDPFPQSSVNHPHYDESEIPELPDCYPDGLRYILHNMVLDNPLERMTERRAMLCAGMMLFHPKSEDMRIESDVLTYYQARILSLLSAEKPQQHMYQGQSLTMEESIRVLYPVLESDFLYNTSTSEFWEIYQFLKMRNLL